MFMQTTMCPVATPTQLSALDALMAEPETPVSDVPLYSPNAAGALLLAALLLLSPVTPKETKQK